MQAFTPLTFKSGHTMHNRFVLAPMTNCQSAESGELSNEECNWLSLRGEGGFAMVMTCASHVHLNGKGFPGQLGIYSDKLNSGHKLLTSALKHSGAISIIQLFHAGLRSPKELIRSHPMAPSDVDKYGAKAMSAESIQQTITAFVDAAKRAEACGYDGVELHGAHGYLLAQFLSSKYNQRTDEYGGGLRNRSRILFEIIHKIREQTGPNFMLGLRLSPERFGMDIEEIQELFVRLVEEDKLDFIDVSLWDHRKLPEAESLQDLSLLEYFSSLDRKQTKLTVSGKVLAYHDVQFLLEQSIDFVGIGRGGILHSDFPNQCKVNPNFECVRLPVTPSYLAGQGLSPKFIQYMRRWDGFVDDSFA